MPDRQNSSGGENLLVVEDNLPARYNADRAGTPVFYHCLPGPLRLRKDAARSSPCHNSLAKKLEMIARISGRILPSSVAANDARQLRARAGTPRDLARQVYLITSRSSKNGGICLPVLLTRAALSIATAFKRIRPAAQQNRVNVLRTISPAGARHVDPSIEFRPGGSEMFFNKATGLRAAVLFNDDNVVASLPGVISS